VLAGFLRQFELEFGVVLTDSGKQAGSAESEPEAPRPATHCAAGFLTKIIKEPTFLTGR
jgi:hypothetical protein